MNKIILAPDSFKGTLSAMQICDIMEAEIHAVYPDCQVLSLPVADGGEGTCDCFLTALPGEKIYLTVKGPFGEPVESFYCLVNDGKTGIVEMAAAAGLTMVNGRKNPRLTTTYGVGELILDAISRGATEILVGLGGSATNDGAAGLAAALGVLFLNEKGDEFIPTGGTLTSIKQIDTSKVNPLLTGIKLQAMCDVDCPLTGEKGAAFVFGPQKGADEAMVKELDLGLHHLGTLLAALPPFRLMEYDDKDIQYCSSSNADILTLPGGGAAGGMGAGMHAMLGCTLTPGIEAVLKTVCFDDMLSGCDLILTGEGRIDGQSRRGKVVVGVAGRGKKAAVPVCAIVGGALDEELSDLEELGLCGVFPINRQALDFEQSKGMATQFMRSTIHSLLLYTKAMGK